MTNVLFARFALEAVETPWLWIVGIVLGMAFLFWTYRGIFLRSKRNLAWTLMLLRGAGLVALLITLAKPAWVRDQEHVEPGRVAVIIDNSVSMSLPSGGSARYDRVKLAVADIQKALEAKHGSAMVVDLFDLSGQPIPETGIPPEPKLERTDIARSIREVVARSRSKPLAAVVLLSDGMDNTGRTDFQDLSNLTVPVFTVGFAQEADPDTIDLAVRKPQVPQRAMVNNEVKIDVPVAKTGNNPLNEVTVALKRGDEVITSQVVSFAAGVGEQTVSLKWTPKQPGTFHFTVKAESPTAEPVLINNAQGFDLPIDGEPIRIVFLDGGLRWESRYLLDQLRNDPDIQLESSIRVVNPERLAGRPNKEMLTTERLSKTDIVILGDMEGKFLSDAEYDALTKWLEGKNHSLLVLGGYKSFGADGWAKTPLAKVLPVSLAEGEPYQREGRFALGFSDEGRRHPIFELTGDREKDVVEWEQTAELDGLCLVGREKPGATVLAIHPTLMIADKPAIVAAFQPFGEGGKSMVFTADTTWKWSRLPRLIGRPDTLYSRFWSQTMRWLANRNLDDRRPLLTVSTDSPAYAMGKSVGVKIVRTAPPGGNLANSEAIVEYRSLDGQPTKVTVQANSANPDEFVGSFTPPAGGRYELVTSLMSEGKLLANQRSEFYVQSSALELADPRTNPSGMEGIARVTRGKFFDIALASKVVDDIAMKERRTVESERTEFWNSRWLFLFFLAAITIEWFTRRRNHMV